MPNILPLEDATEVVNLIALVTGKPEKEVATKLLGEVTGGNVVKDEMEAKGIPFGVASEELDKFYNESDAFLYETSYWNSTAVKQSLIETVVAKLGTPKKQVLCFGDGLGFDSTRLTLAGHKCLYYEPGKVQQQFAREIWKRNKVEVTMLKSLDEISPDSLEAIVCLDVLEHVPDPPELVKSFVKWLKPGGILITSSPFALVGDYWPTHLKSNVKYSGNDEAVFGGVGLKIIDTNLLQAPIVHMKEGGEKIPDLTYVQWSTLQMSRAIGFYMRIRFPKYLINYFNNMLDQSPWQAKLEELAA